ncbi:hypothetical protein O181_002307 [Austropuccinia psidii MF-1]|uniref:Uncharacterized protein n=1 Tax=Austropuccinia psidii MF-1 TaxID=1389203 RepID=A0A9Q3BC81_9BASI|nr:hypothetical protein [Austropuccinia psidii MF-1]
MLELPIEGEFQTLELLSKNVINVSWEKGYSGSSLRFNMTQNQIEICCDRSGTPNSHKTFPKTVTSRNLDCPVRLLWKKDSKSTTWTLKVKNPEQIHYATEAIMSHPTFRKFNKQETSQIVQMSESLLITRQIQAQLSSQREPESPAILQDIYNQVNKIKKDRIQGRIPIDALIGTLKEENLVWSSARVTEGHITSLFSLIPLP